MNSRRLRQRIEWVLPELSATFRELLMHPQFRELFPEFQIALHQMVRATVPLMRTAVARCRELESTDRVAAAMVPYLEQHIKEELHHDEWLLEDLEFLGIPRSDVLRRMPSSSVASLIGGHYYWIHHHHPVAKLGQIAVMEGYPAGIDLIDLLVERTGYARPAFRTLEKHCHLDTHHRDDFDEALNRMPLTEEHHAILEVSALHTVRLIARVYRDLLEQAAGTRGQGTLIPLRSPSLVVGRTHDGHFQLEDPLRGAGFQIGEQEYFLLTQCDGRRSCEAVRHAYAVRFGEPLGEGELAEFLRMAAEEALITADGPDVAGTICASARTVPDR
jgi:hypothetical protein